MIVRIVVSIGVVVTVGAWLLVVPFAPEPTQASMKTSADTYRDMGYLPKSGKTRLSDAIDHEVFEVPASDMMQSQGSMQGMNMGMMEMAAMKDGDMAMMKDGDMAAMKDGDMAMMEENHESVEEEEESSGGEGLKIIKSTAVKIDRTVQINMRDWSFDADRVMVKKGQTIRLVITNSGNTPHEFMLMSMAGMQMVNYRLERADWNLLEHESIYEVPVMMPGDTVEAILEIEDSGLWMFMCMFPYHMQMGMMGVMLTPDRMDMLESMAM